MEVCSTIDNRSYRTDSSSHEHLLECSTMNTFILDDKSTVSGTISTGDTDERTPEPKYDANFEDTISAKKNMCNDSNVKSLDDNAQSEAEELNNIGGVTQDCEHVEEQLVLKDTSVTQDFVIDKAPIQVQRQAETEKVADQAHATEESSPGPSSLSNDHPVSDEHLARVLESDRPVRKARRRQCTDHVTCTVCHARIPRDKASEHVRDETARLEKWLTHYIKKSEKRQSTEASCSSSRCTLGGDGDGTSTHGSRYQTYQRVKRNRIRRGPVRRREAEGVECPVCSERVTGSQDQVNEHVNLCLAKGETSDVDIEASDSDSHVSEGSLEEYEWAGQTRVRVAAGSNLARAGWAVGTRAQNGEEEEDVELDIEQDESQLYGESQYGERDVVPCEADEPSEERQRQALRQAILTADEASSACSSQTSSNKWNISEDQTDNPTQDQTPNQSDTLSEPKPGTSYSSVPHPSASSTVMQTLKTRIRDLEKSLEKSNKFRCLICMEPYDKPVTSVQCWHVYCEECWLRTLGMKKLCPQCNMITSPGDLRKIYL